VLNPSSLVVREAIETDAGAFIQLRDAIDAETSFLLREPGEDIVEISEMGRRIQSIARCGNHTLLVADLRGKLVGYLHATGGRLRRTHGTASFSMGVPQSVARMGIGTQLVQHLEQWAAGAGVHRLEFVVSPQNIASIALFLKFGYAVEGVKRAAVVVDGVPSDRICMAKILFDPGATRR